MCNDICDFYLFIIFGHITACGISSVLTSDWTQIMAVKAWSLNTWPQGIPYIKNSFNMTIFPLGSFYIF